ncbi:MAG: threonine dehydratase [Hyphomicrobiaceae bacterium]|nr:threonine dehydratase [Hyphomicrobiaceae bacterium]
MLDRPRLLTPERLEEACRIVRAAMPETPSYAWPALEKALGVTVVVKHESHTPTGAFKVRGGLVLLDGLMRGKTPPKAIVSATRGNHGQSLAFAAARHGLGCTIAVPVTNSPEKNAAMRAFGARVVEEGADFDTAIGAARRIAEEDGAYFVPSFAEPLVAGVATYAVEFLRSHSDLETVYVPIGLGSGICGMIEARDALGLKTKIVGVVSEKADGYARSLECGKLTATDSAATFADGMAVRCPSEEALSIIARGAERLVRVSDTRIAEAMRLYFSAIHATAEGAGAAALAALIDERAAMQGRQVGVVLSGQNVDSSTFRDVLSGATPVAA